MGVTYPGAQVTGTEFVSGRLVICTEGSLHANGPVTIAGAVDLTGPVALTGPVSGDVGVTGDVSITGDAGITGDVSIAGSAALTGPVTLGPVSGDVGVTGDVSITGYTSFTGSVGVTGDTSVVGSVGVTGTVTAATPGIGFVVAEGDGSNAKQGTVVLADGAATVTNAAVTASSRIFLTGQDDGGGTPGWLRVSARTPGVSFTVTSSSVLDTSTVAYEIFEPAVVTTAYKRPEPQIRHVVPARARAGQPGPASGPAPTP
jgi:hypothetical protein